MLVQYNWCYKTAESSTPEALPQNFPRAEQHSTCRDEPAVWQVICRKNPTSSLDLAKAMVLFHVVY
jgi:hypothetical protein